MKGDPRNDQDFVFKRVPVERRDLVLAEFVPTGLTDVKFAARFDVILGGVR